MMASVDPHNKCRCFIFTNLLIVHPPSNLQYFHDLADKQFDLCDGVRHDLCCHHLLDGLLELFLTDPTSFCTKAIEFL